MSDSEADGDDTGHCSGLINGVNETIGKWTIRSDFDSGNLAKVCRQGGRDNAFDLWTAPDAAGTPYENVHRSWFHFSVTGGHCAGSTVTLSIVNLNQQGKLYKQDFRPLVRVDGKHGWERIKMEPHTLSYTDENDEKQFRVTWRHKFDMDHQTAYFAFCYPWSYEECTKQIDMYEDRHGVSERDNKPASLKSPSTIYFHRETLAMSLEGRRMEMMTISSHRGILDDREEPLEWLPPSAVCTRPHVFIPSKAVVFISARVHPGETPASHVFNGVLEFLLRADDERASALRDQFVFKLVPILNPDGVVNGHYRTDSRGINLNRFYHAPDPHEHPTIWAVRTYLERLHQEEILDMYIDLHGHASKRGCFIYGNAIPDMDDHVENVLYPKLISLNCPHFEFPQCNFTEKNMRSKDKRDGLSKEGSGRVAMYNATGLTHCYTLECNYNTGRMLSRVGATVKGSGRTTPEFNGRGRPPKYTNEHWEHVGRAVLVAILDLHDTNPWSRIPNCEFGSLDALRSWVRSWVRSAQKLEKRKAAKRAGGSSGSITIPSVPRPSRDSRDSLQGGKPKSSVAATRSASTTALSQKNDDTVADSAGTVNPPVRKKRPGFDKKAAAFREKLAERAKERQAAIQARKAAREERARALKKEKSGASIVRTSNTRYAYVETSSSVSVRGDREFQIQLASGTTVSASTSNVLQSRRVQSAGPVRSPAGSDRAMFQHHEFEGGEE